MNHTIFTDLVCEAVHKHSRSDGDLPRVASRLLDVQMSIHSLNVPLLDRLLTICDRARRYGIDNSTIDGWLLEIQQPANLESCVA